MERGEGEREREKEKKRERVCVCERERGDLSRLTAFGAVETFPVVDIIQR